MLSLTSKPPLCHECANYEGNYIENVIVMEEKEKQEALSLKAFSNSNAFILQMFVNKFKNIFC